MTLLGYWLTFWHPYLVNPVSFLAYWLHVGNFVTDIMHIGLLLEHLDQATDLADVFVVVNVYT